MLLKWKIRKRKKYLAKLKKLKRDIEILGLEIQSNPKHKCRMITINKNNMSQIFRCKDCGVETLYTT